MFIPEKNRAGLEKSIKVFFIHKYHLDYVLHPYFVRNIEQPTLNIEYFNKRKNKNKQSDKDTYELT